jgi:hypothetical protein
MIHLEQLLENRRIARLFVAFIGQGLTESESQELDDWISESTENQIQFARLTDPGYRAAARQFLEQIDWDTAIFHQETDEKQ